MQADVGESDVDALVPHPRLGQFEEPLRPPLIKLDRMALPVWNLVRARPCVGLRPHD
jgi:hypothetical protein